MLVHLIDTLYKTWSDNPIEALWVAIGLFGQTLFMCRFIVQWIASERAKRSVIPKTFWYFSLAGGIVLLAYAIWRQDPVFILGQLPGVLIYSRNLYLIYKTEKAVGGGGQ